MKLIINFYELDTIILLRINSIKNNSIYAYKMKIVVGIYQRSVKIIQNTTSNPGFILVKLLEMWYYINVTVMYRI